MNREIQQRLVWGKLFEETNDVNLSHNPLQISKSRI